MLTLGEDTLDGVRVDVLLAVVMGTGGGDTVGKLTFCDSDINVPPPINVPLPGPDDCDELHI
jgi:hypothetical protein